MIGLQNCKFNDWEAICATRYGVRMDNEGTTEMIDQEGTALNSKEWLWLGALAILLLITYLSPLKEHLTHVQEIKDMLAGYGAMAPLVFVCAMSLVTAVGIPRMVIYPLGGLVFGFAEGLAWSLLATVIGAYLTFLYARWSGRSLVVKRWPSLSKITTKLDNRGFLSVALIRQMPSPGFLTNLLFGLSSVRTRCFLAGTILGSIPSAIPATLIGSSVSHGSDDHRILYTVMAIAVLLIMWLGFSFTLRDAVLGVAPQTERDPNA